jgi:hypothetical protein
MDCFTKKTPDVAMVEYADLNRGLGDKRTVMTDLLCDLNKTKILRSGMSKTKLKQAFIEGNNEPFEYSGNAENGLRILLIDSDFFYFQPKQIVEILAVMAQYNPLLDDSTDPKPCLSHARFERWIEGESFGYFGRQLSAHDALRIRSVFRAEGILTSAEFPHADKLTALKECVGKICIYREKGLFLRVKLARVTCEDESVFLALHVIDTPGFSSDLKKITVGSAFDYLTIWHGYIEACMPSWTLVTGNALVEHLTAFAATLPDTHAFIKELRKTQWPSLC